MHQLKVVVQYFTLESPQAENMKVKASLHITSSVEDLDLSIWVAIKNRLFARLAVILSRSGALIIDN